MSKNFCCDLEELLSIFGESISSADILSSKALAEISATIVKYRIEMGMTQKQFAQHMNVSQSMVSKWESSDYNFTVKGIAEIAAKLDLDLHIRLQKSSIVQMPRQTERISHYSSIQNDRYKILQFEADNDFRKCKNQVRRYLEETDDLIFKEE